MLGKWPPMPKFIHATTRDSLSWSRLTLDCRHYVAFIRKQLDKPSWVLFNDEKVVQAVDIDEMRKFGYAYFFKRVQN